MRGSRLYLSLIAALSLTACATTTGSRPAAGGDRFFLNVEEIRTLTAARTLDEAIRQRRPQWLSTRGSPTLQNSGGDVVVYLDGVRAGGPGILQTVPLDDVESARFLSAADATTRFGTGHPVGAILVETRRR